MNARARHPGKPTAAHQAAAALAAAGHHVHYVAHAEQICLTGECRPTPPVLDGTGPKERP
ncbi:hypothetical protein [Streptomyces sp. enrichment culture]|uniref:hypothetical protein n=1 Tax=Streptomyces sp. enrichment culture TaxID=1795815 RepID=UPI003F55A8EC